MRILRIMLVTGLLALLSAAIATFFLAGEPSLRRMALAVLIAILDWEPSWAWVRPLAVLVAIFVIGFLIRIGYAYQWTGFGEAELPKPQPENQEVRPKKTLWDWLQLCGSLAIPIVIAILGIWFTTHQESRQQAIEDQRAQATALQSYLDQTGTLLLEEDLSDDKVRTLLRARTLTVLRSLDPSLKPQVVRFLEEAKLVQRVGERDPVIRLTGADLSGANLYEANLSGADLDETNLKGANLSGANLSSADLSGANLSGANLSWANLSEAHLLVTNLSGANLLGANLSGAFLLGDKLNGANLKRGNLSGAELAEVNLSGVQGVTNDQLAEAMVFKNVTMPNGQKYEDWLKDREGRKEDE